MDVSQRLIDQLRESTSTSLDVGTETMTLTDGGLGGMEDGSDAKSLRSKASLTLDKIEEGRNHDHSHHHRHHHHHHDQHDDEEDDEGEANTKEEYEETVRRRKTLYLGLIIVLWFALALVVIVPTHVLLKKAEKDECSNNLLLDALSASLQSDTKRRLKSTEEELQSLSLAITANAEATLVEWPYLPKNNPYFDLQANNLQEKTDGRNLEAIGFAPLILNQEERDTWERISSYYHVAAEHDNSSRVTSFIFSLPETSNGPSLERKDAGPCAPLWQGTPSILKGNNDYNSSSLVNWDLLSHRIFRHQYASILKDRKPAWSDILEMGEVPWGSTQQQHYLDNSFSIITVPVFDKLPTTTTQSSGGEQGNIRGLLFGVVSWNDLLSDVVQSALHDFAAPEDTAASLEVTLKNTCGSSISIPMVNDESDVQHFQGLREERIEGGGASCQYRLLASPLGTDQDLQEEDSGVTVNPAVWFPVVQALLFLAIGAILFLVLLLLSKETDAELRDSNINAESDYNASQVFSFYEIECALHNSKSKLGVTDDDISQSGKSIWKQCNHCSRKGQLMAFVEEVNKMAVNHPVALLKSKPLADIFLETTILQADIAKFTAWSSERDPAEIFRLLETIYQTFNEMAVAQGILTLDVIGDCYICVAGISNEKQQQHAIKMARFALHALTAMQKVTSALEIVFGPETSKLSIRVGLHSGPVTLGVLRCAGRSRLQLFGESVNTAAKMESTGEGGRIHVSRETAQLLREGGKASWLIPRRELVMIRGNEEPVESFWLVHEDSLDMSTSNNNARGLARTITEKSVSKFLSSTGSFIDELPTEDEAEDEQKVLVGDHRRLVDWHVEQMLQILRRLMAKRIDLGLQPQAHRDMQCIERLSDNSSVMDAVEEVIDLPKYWGGGIVDAEDIEVPADVVTELYELVTIMSTLYRRNPFHNFEHASHVVMSVIKLNSRIASQDGKWEDNVYEEPYSKENSFSYIASDPLVQFAFVFAALIHDLDHSGVSNDQLVKEGARVARVYNNESVAEQNSYDVAIDLLMEPVYSSLRKVIFATEEEMKLFLQLTKQTVIATDIMNQKLKDLRNSRWDKAFKKQEEEAAPNRDDKDVNRKATIFIEHLIQASDVSHTMQHWHIFRKWNQRLFEEMYLAFKAGRSTKDPSEFWYRGEIGFFDFYIIPLAKKLKDCGVFGVYSDEYLNNAQRNRDEWELKGEEIVAQMLAEVQLLADDEDTDGDGCLKVIPKPKTVSEPHKDVMSAQSA